MAKSKPFSTPSSEKPAFAGEVKRNSNNGTREFVESVVIAIILAFMFRAFEAEAFVIPTGSMAPTLMGEHKDVICSECGQPYQTSASGDRNVTETTCPTCRYPMELDPVANPNQGNFSGDRILVSKFAYEIAEPKRWDVIVFKYPGNAKQNYIKRLIGLPGETIRVHHGDIYVKGAGEQQFQIARRTPDKINAMLQLVHDNDHQSETLAAIGWPPRWSDETGANSPEQGYWTASEDQRTFSVAVPAGERASLYYRHRIPSEHDWFEIEQGNLPTASMNSQGELITDFCAYNTFKPNYDSSRSDVHWVGDIAVEFELSVKSGDGQFTCELVEAGVHYQCIFDLASKRIVLTRADGESVFSVNNGTAGVVEAPSPITGSGTYHVRMANVNDSICLWVDGSPISFDQAGPVVAYDPPAEDRPHWSMSDPEDLAPARLSATGLEASATSLKILRDVYYVAIDRTLPEYELRHGDDYDFPPGAINGILSDPTTWDQTDLFASRRAVEFELDHDEFFPMGDNSPQSLDGRLWETPPAPRAAVPRRLMIGKALVVYWPHTWNSPVPLTPNPQKMRLIK